MRAVDLRKSYQFNEAKIKTNIFSSLKYAEMFEQGCKWHCKKFS